MQCIAVPIIPVFLAMCRRPHLDLSVVDTVELNSLLTILHKQQINHSKVWYVELNRLLVAVVVPFVPCLIHYIS